MSFPAPAKINLALHITGKRPDGYHNLESLVIFTRFGDRVTVEASEEDSVEISGPFGGGLSTGNDNLVVQARDALRAFAAGLPASLSVPPPLTPPLKGEGEYETMVLSDREAPSSTPPSPLRGGVRGGGVPSSVHIRLEKNLPVASGVGGGSSDAAATLRALNQLWQTGLAEAQLAEIGLALGADVPMCLAARPLVARGVGADLSPVDDVPAVPLVLVNPCVAVPTAAVFAALETADNAPLPPLPSSFDFHGLRNWLELTRNDLEAPARKLAPAVDQAIRALDRANSGFSRMSGSGATCFGLFETNNVAKRAAADIRQRRPDWFVATTRALPSKDET